MPKPLGKITLLRSGAFDALEPGIMAADLCSLEKPCMLVYVGSFQSMNGPVEVTEEHVDRLVTNHNSTLSRFAASLTGGIPMRACPPLQLDHSTSAVHTVGRVVGALTKGTHTLEDGSVVPAVFGPVRVLGRENVEKVQDGRWCHVSIGADLEKGKLSELSITPFPAAEEASLLGKGNENSEDEKMNKAKAKKFLMEKKKLSEKEADEKLAKCEADKDEEKKLAAEVDEDDKKMAAEDEEAKKKLAEEEDKKKKELAASVKALTELSASIMVTHGNVSKLAKRQGIVSQLSRLRGAAKVTPAEIKNINIDELSGKPEAEVSAFLKAFDAREPQVLVGLVGSATAEEIASVAKQQRLSKLEAEVRKGMPFTGKALAAQDKLSAETEGGDKDKKPAKEVDMAALSDEEKEIEKMMGDNEPAKEKFRAYARKMKTRMAGGHTDEMAGDQEKSSQELASAIVTMQNQMEQVQKLSAAIAGVKL